LTLVAPNIFKSEGYFLQDYCRQDSNGHWQFRPGGEVELAKRISPYYMRRTKEQAGIVLPPKTIVLHEIEIDDALYPNQARARNEMRKWGSIMLDPAQGKVIAANAKIAVYTRLRQIEVWPAGIQVKDPLTGEIMLKVDIEESQKIDEIIRYEQDPSEVTGEWEGIIPEVVSDERVVVFSQFIPPLYEIKRRCELAGLRVGMMIGDVKDADRDEVHMDFDLKYTPNRADAKYDIVLCHYKVGGIGVNLTAATQMIVLDEEWSPGKRDQAYDRIHRMGQDKPVTIHVLRSHFKVGSEVGGIDTWLANIIDEKEEMIEGFHRSADDIAAEAFDRLKSGLL
jgi:SNF2 family DNA or RNA helicase